MKFVMPRDFRLSHMGHSIHFHKDEPIFVPPTCRAEARKFGAIPAEGEADDGLEVDIAGERPEFATAAEEPQGEDRQNRLLEAVDYLVKENDAKKFGGNGAPKIPYITDLVHFRIDATERNQIWDLHNARKNAEANPTNVNTAPDPETAAEVDKAEAEDDA